MVNGLIPTPQTSLDLSHSYTSGRDHLRCHLFVRGGNHSHIHILMAISLGETGNLKFSISLQVKLTEGVGDRTTEPLYLLSHSLYIYSKM